MSTPRAMTVSGENDGPAEARKQLLADLPVTDRRVDLAGVSTAMLEGGSGPPIVLLHGPGEFAAIWMRVIPDLVTSLRVAEAASARYGWPLHVLERAADDPCLDQPEAFMAVLRNALGDLS